MYITYFVTFDTILKALRVKNFGGIFCHPK